VLDCNKYKTGVDRSDHQMLSYKSFARKTIKWRKKLLFHVFDLVLVSAHILHNKSSKQKMSLEIFYKKVAELFACRERPFLYRIPATHATLDRTSQHSCRVCAERHKRLTNKAVKKCTTLYCRKCDVGLCIGQCFEVYHSKLNYWE
jgi:hypothetical protein